MNAKDRDTIMMAINKAKETYEKFLLTRDIDPLPPISITVKPLICYEDENVYGQIVDEVIKVADFIKPLTRKEREK